MVSRHSNHFLITFLFSNIHKFRDKLRSSSIILPWISIGPIQPANISLIEQQFQSALTHFGYPGPGPYALECGSLHAELVCIYVCLCNMNINEIFWGSANKRTSTKTAKHTILYLCHAPSRSILSHTLGSSADVLGVKKGVTQLKGVNANYPNRQMSLHWGVSEDACQFFHPSRCLGFVLVLVISPSFITSNQFVYVESIKINNCKKTQIRKMG